MGYRSDVQGVYVFPDRDKRAVFWAELQLLAGENEALADEMQELTPRKHGNEYLFYFEQHDVKWYEDYEEVRAHALMRELAEKHGGGWVFGRIGEEHDDIEITSGECEDFQVDEWEYVHTVTSFANDLSTFEEDTL